MNNFLSQVKGFTPVIDALAQETSLTTAAVYGVVWRYCQMEDRICRASLERIGGRIGISRKSVERHIKELCKQGYLIDTTPDKRNSPHIYKDSGRVQIIGLVEARYTNETVRQNDSPAEVGQNGLPVGQNVLPRSDKMSYEESSKESNKRNPESPTAGAAAPIFQTPSNLQHWLRVVNDASNKNGAVMWMHKVLFPDLEPPAYGWLGKVAKKVGGPGRLAQLLWQAAGQQVTGDPLLYCLGITKGDKGNGKSNGRQIDSAGGRGERITDDDITSADREHVLGC